MDGGVLASCRAVIRLVKEALGSASEFLVPNRPDPGGSHNKIFEGVTAKVKRDDIPKGVAAYFYIGGYSFEALPLVTL